MNYIAWTHEERGVGVGGQCETSEALTMGGVVILEGSDMTLYLYFLEFYHTMDVYVTVSRAIRHPSHCGISKSHYRDSKLAIDL